MHCLPSLPEWLPLGHTLHGDIRGHFPRQLGGPAAGEQEDPDPADAEEALQLGWLVRVGGGAGLARLRGVRRDGGGTRHFAGGGPAGIRDAGSLGEPES